MEDAKRLFFWGGVYIRIGHLTLGGGFLAACLLLGTLTPSSPSQTSIRNLPMRFSGTKSCQGVSPGSVKVTLEEGDLPFSFNQGGRVERPQISTPLYRPQRSHPSNDQICLLPPIFCVLLQYSKTSHSCSPPNQPLEQTLNAFWVDLVFCPCYLVDVVKDPHKIPFITQTTHASGFFPSWFPFKTAKTFGIPFPPKKRRRKKDTNGGGGEAIKNRSREKSKNKTGSAKARSQSATLPGLGINWPQCGMGAKTWAALNLGSVPGVPSKFVPGILLSRQPPDTRGKRAFC